MTKKAKMLFYSARSYDKISFRRFLAELEAKIGSEGFEGRRESIDVTFVETSLGVATAPMAYGYDAVCAFVNDDLSGDVVRALASAGVRLIALRCAGYDNVDLDAARDNGIRVIRVPRYSPESVAEHAATLMMAVNRRIHKAYTRVRDNNFSLTGLSGYCLSGKTAGVVGMGNIGSKFANICKGLGMKVIAYDPMADDPSRGLRLRYPDVEFVPLDELYAKSDVISLHLLLNDSTRHMVNAEAIAKMKDDVILINVSRGGLVDNDALIDGIRAGKFFGVGLDVYDGEDDNVYTNHEDDILMQSTTARLLSFPNVIITSHQAFLTDVALREIAEATCVNAIEFFACGKVPEQYIVY